MNDKIGLSPAEAAQALGVDTQTIRRAIRHPDDNKRLRARKIFRRVVILRSDLDAWLRECSL